MFGCKPLKGDDIIFDFIPSVYFDLFFSVLFLLFILILFRKRKIIYGLIKSLLFMVFPLHSSALSASNHLDEIYSLFERKFCDVFLIDIKNREEVKSCLSDANMLGVFLEILTLKVFIFTELVSGNVLFEEWYRPNLKDLKLDLMDELKSDCIDLSSSDLLNRCVEGNYAFYLLCCNFDLYNTLDLYYTDF